MFVVIWGDVAVLQVLQLIADTQSCLMSKGPQSACKDMGPTQRCGDALLLGMNGIVWMAQTNA